jgi:hypothetical protein
MLEHVSRHLLLALTAIFFLKKAGALSFIKREKELQPRFTYTTTGTDSGKQKEHASTTVEDRYPKTNKEH